MPRPARSASRSARGGPSAAEDRVAYSAKLRVYYQDTDAGGVMFHARYLNFFERARTDWLRHIGFSVSDMADRDGLLFIVREVQVSYMRPAVLEDLLTVTVGLAHMGGAHFLLVQQALRGDERLARASIDLACITAKQFRPARVPDALRNALETSMSAEVTQKEEA
ncbi:MAG: tol-pal system-associated acyl-CoA thioesterase [Betaproteobacteria bacterium]